MSIPVTADTTTINGYTWRQWDKIFTFDDMDWTDVVIDPGGTIFGPGPYLKVAYGGDDPDWHGTRHRVRPRRDCGKWDFVREDGQWLMVRR